jgi:cytochrome c oxidase subunit II
MPRGPLLRLLAVGLVAGAISTAFALFIPWLPDAGSEQADRIHFVFWFATVICVVIFALVAAVAVYSVWKFRARPDDDSDGAPIHGHTGLEIWWTAGPAVLVTAIAVVSAVVLARNDDAEGAMRINVTAQQFAWSFQYPTEGNLATTTLRLPVDQKIKLYIQAKDVLHSFWVPEFSQKQDAVPGETTTLVITPTMLGTYPIVCTELCGLGHATMRSTVEVVSRADFQKWVSDQRSAIGGGGANAGKAVFEQNGCGSCHTFKPAGSTGKVGPDLDNLQQAAQKAGQPLEEFVHTSIVDPNKYVAPGFAPNVMPSTFGSLPKDQLDALVAFLSTASKE